MRFLDQYQKYTLENDPNWFISRDEKVLLYFINGFNMYRAWGVGNLATKIEIEGGVILRNIYVKEDCRGQGLFTEVMDEIYLECMMRGIGLFLMPNHFEFSICPFEKPQEAKIITLYEQKREDLYKVYEKMGFKRIKSAYFDMNRSYRTKIINTTISGENQKAQKDEVFSPIQVVENMGFNWLTNAPENLLPFEGIFL